MVSKPVTVHDFRRDTLFPRIERAVVAILVDGKVVAPVDVLVSMDILAPDDLEDWRFGRVPYLERVIRGSLPRLSRLLRILAFHCHDLNLVATQTTYVKWGEGASSTAPLYEERRARLENVYGRHFVWPGKGAFHPPSRKSTKKGVPPVTSVALAGSIDEPSQR